MVMLVAAGALRALLSAQLPAVALLCIEIIVATVAFVGTVHLLGPAMLSDARALLRDLLRPERTADTGIAS
jgi:hypothetical protein